MSLIRVRSESDQSMVMVKDSCDGPDNKNNLYNNRLNRVSQTVNARGRVTILDSVTMCSYRLPSAPYSTPTDKPVETVVMMA